MGVCVSLTEAKLNRQNNKDKDKANNNHNNNQPFPEQNDKVINVTIPTDNIRQDNQNNPVDIMRNNETIEKDKDKDKEKDQLKKEELSLNQLITMSFENQNNHSQIKKEDDKASSNKIQITNKDEQLYKYEYCLYSFIDLNVNLSSVSSTENEWNHTIKYVKKISNVHIANRLLALNERRWNKENIQLVNIIKSTRDHIDSYILNKYLNNRIKLHEHFNWLLWALSIYYKHSLLNSCQNDFNAKDLGLPEADSTEWLIGFEWKGIYIKIIDESHSFKLKREIKALNYLFFEYIQIIDNVPVSNDSELNLLSNEIVFPLITYSKFNGLYLMASVCIPKIQIDHNDLIEPNVNSYSQRKETILKTAHFKDTVMSNTINDNDIFIKDRDKDSISHIANDNDSIHLINDTHIYNKNIDLNQFSLEDLNMSHLFSNIKESNFVKLIDNSDIQTGTSNRIQHKEKYMLINAVELIPNLFHSNAFSSSEAMVIEDNKPITYIKSANGNSNSNNGIGIGSGSGSGSGSGLDIIDIIKTHMPGLQAGECKCRYESEAYGVGYKIYSYSNNQGYSSNRSSSNSSNNNPAVNSFFIRNHINQLSKELYEKVSTPSINKIQWLKKVLIASKRVNVSNKALIAYSLMKDIKIKYALITQHEQTIKFKGQLYDDQYHKRIKFSNYIEQFAKVVSNLKGVIDYAYLSNIFNRYGINKVFQVFLLAKISNSSIADLIKIDILTSIIAACFNFEEGVNLMAKVSIINYEFGNKEDVLANSGYDNNTIKEKTISSIRVSKLHLMILTILNISNAPNDYSKKIMDQISYALFIKSLKWRIIDKEFNFNLFNSKLIDEPFSIYSNFTHSKMLQELISIARNNPFLFISSIEKKLYFSIAPDIKLASSISIEHFIQVFTQRSICVNDPVIKSYINPIEITYYLLAKSIETTSKGLKYELEKEQIQFNTNTKLIYTNNQPSVNQSKLSQDICESTSFNKDNQQPNITMDKCSRNYVYKLKPNNITKINNMNNKYIPSNNNVNAVDIDIDSKSNLTDIRHNTKREINNSNAKNANYNRIKYWDVISSVFQFHFPPLLYKIIFVYNEILNDKKTIYKYLSHTYKIKQIEIIKDWKSNAEMVLNEVYSVNIGEHTILHVYLFLFLHYIFVADDIKSAKEIMMKIKDKFHACAYYSLNWLIIWNYLNGLLKEKVNFIESEEFYSKTIIFALYLFGDSRGRNSKGHYISLFPLWKIARQTCILDNILTTNEALKELFYCQDYWFKTLLSPSSRSKQNNWFILSLKYISPLPQCEPKFRLVANGKEDTVKKKDNNNIDNRNGDVGDDNDNDNVNSDQSCNCTDDLLERPSLNPSISDFDKRFILSERNLDLSTFDIIDFPFPSISNTQYANAHYFHSEKFFVFLLKSISSIIFQGDYYPYNDEYLTKIGINFESPTYQLVTSESSLSKMNVQTNGSAHYNNNNHSNKKGKGNNKNILSPYLYEILLKRLDFKLRPPNGIVVAWGNNSHNETSHNNYNCLFYPRIVFKLKEEEIIKLSAGWEYSIVISKEKTGFGWGNNQYGQCGVGEGQNVSNPTLIKGLNNIKDVSCGNEHSLAITNDGTLYSWGNPEDGVLGYKSKTAQYTPMKVNSISGIQQIACGTIHNLALTKDGHVYSWGCSKGGQLGLSEKYLLSLKDFNGFISEPTLIDSIKQEIIVSISSGEAHSIALTSKGKVYTWGFGSNGQLGLNFCEDSFEPGLGLVKSRRLVPVQLPFEDKISHIQAGKTFSMIITEKKELYAFGVNDLNQLGIDDDAPMTHLHSQIDLYNNKCSDFVSPTRLEIFINMQVLRIACGESHCLGIVKDLSNQVKTLWSWGSNRFGQLGQGSQNKKSTPKPVNYFLGYSNSEISDIACGGFHSLCLLKGKETRFFDEDTIIFRKLIENIVKIWK